MQTKLGLNTQVYVLGILILTCLIYIPIFNNGLVWDDELYITNNKLIKSLDWTTIKNIFGNLKSDNYAPITELFGALQYAWISSSPSVFHLTSLIFHLCNVFFVFYFFKTITKNDNIGLIVSLLFAIHPLQVESVAWASARSNVFYVFFFLLGLVSYLKYINSNKLKWLVITIVFFLCSVLSKAVAVVFPAILILIDIYLNRSLNRKNIFEKLLFVILAVGIGLLTISLKSEHGALQEIPTYNLLQRIVFAGYAVVNYIGQTILPIHLSAYYPYPVSAQSNIKPVVYLISILSLIPIALAIYNYKKSKKLFFGIMFFIVSIALLLQFLPVAGAIRADRYMYLPIIGLCYICAETFELLCLKKGKLFANVGLSIVVIAFAYLSYQRSHIWKNDFTLWNSVIEVYDNVPVAYNNRAVCFQDSNKYQESIQDLQRAVQLRPNYADAYNNLGIAYAVLGKFPEALTAFNQCINLKPNSKNYNNRANALRDMRRYEDAIQDYTNAIELSPNYIDAIMARAFCNIELQRYEPVLKDLTHVISMQPQNYNAILNRGIAYGNLGSYKESYADFDKCISLQPQNALAYLNRGNIYIRENRFVEALKEFEKTISLNPNSSVGYYKIAQAAYLLKKSSLACENIKKSAQMGYQPAKDIMHQICR